jgi:hypothetical protein
VNITKADQNSLDVLHRQQKPAHAIRAITEKAASFPRSNPPKMLVTMKAATLAQAAAMPQAFGASNNPGQAARFCFGSIE